jgi:hypothetical protein
MLNEYAYCPRLFHFMHVEGRWADNEYTVEGRHAHRRVDELDHLLPEAPEGEGKGKRRRNIVSYDISDDKRRGKVFDHLEGRGDHAQFSVFFCQPWDPHFPPRERRRGKQNAATPRAHWQLERFSGCCLAISAMFEKSVAVLRRHRQQRIANCID